MHQKPLMSDSTPLSRTSIFVEPVYHTALQWLEPHYESEAKCNVFITKISLRTVAWKSSRILLTGSGS